MITADELAAMIPGVTARWIRDRVRAGSVAYTRGKRGAHLFTDEQAQAFIAGLAVTVAAEPTGITSGRRRTAARRAA